jgi:RNA recognition motif-containing protein
MTSIYVGNLAFAATEDDLRQAFEAFGQVDEVNIIMDRETGRSRGFAFVQMANDEEAKAAIEEVNNADVAGRNIVVNEARPKTDRRDGGGGGRRY